MQGAGRKRPDFENLLNYEGENMIIRRNVIIVSAVILTLTVLFAGPTCAMDQKFFAITTGN